MTDRLKLDYVPRLDERNRAYRVTAPAADLTTRARYWTPGTQVLDQGQEGACVGFGVVGEAMASPVRVKFSGWGQYPDQVAQSVYRRAQRIDEWEGEQYDGTSVRAGMLVGRERGWWTGFRWAFSMTELRAALETGPIVIGVEWRERMYTAPNGVVTVGGPVVGGHCLLITGYTPNHRAIGGPAYRWLNSWGREYGRNGSAYIDTDGLEYILFRAGGEAAVALGRKL